MFHCTKYVIFKEVKYKGEPGAKGLEIVVYYKDTVYALWSSSGIMHSCINVLKCIDLR